MKEIKEYLQDLEKWILWNISIITFIIILLLILYQIYTKNKLDTQNFITTLWAIIAFWYWYKKYERDKEFEIIEKYTKEYDKIFENTDWLDYKKLLNLWYKELYLYNKWYLSKSLWLDWSKWIENDIDDIIIKDYINKDLEIKNNNWIFEIISNNFIENKKDFYTFLISILNKNIEKNKNSINLFSKYNFDKEFDKKRDFLISTINKKKDIYKNGIEYMKINNKFYNITN